MGIVVALSSKAMGGTSSLIASSSASERRRRHTMMVVISRRTEIVARTARATFCERAEGGGQLGEGIGSGGRGMTNGGHRQIIQLFEPSRRKSGSRAERVCVGSRRGGDGGWSGSGSRRSFDDCRRDPTSMSTSTWSSRGATGSSLVLNPVDFGAGEAETTSCLAQRAPCPPSPPVPPVSPNTSSETCFPRATPISFNSTRFGETGGDSASAFEEGLRGEGSPCAE